MYSKVASAQLDRMDGLMRRRYDTACRPQGHERTGNGVVWGVRLHDRELMVSNSPLALVVLRSSQVQ